MLVQNYKSILYTKAKTSRKLAHTNQPLPIAKRDNMQYIIYCAHQGVAKAKQKFYLEWIMPTFFLVVILCQNASEKTSAKLNVLPLEATWLLSLLKRYRENHNIKKIN